jgi:hypothetical protein
MASQAKNIDRAAAAAILDTMAAGPVNGRLLRPRASARPAGAVAQLGERRNRTAEVRGSNPLGSTKRIMGLRVNHWLTTVRG